MCRLKTHSWQDASLLSLAEPYIVAMMISIAISDDRVGIMTSLRFSAHICIVVIMQLFVIKA